MSEREENIAIRIADRIIKIQEVDGGYDYSIMGLNYIEIDGGVYDNPEVTIRQALEDIVTDLKENPDYNGAKGAIKISDEIISLEYENVSEKAELANKIGSHVYESRSVLEFKEKTLEHFHPIGDQEPEDIEDTVEAYVNALIAEYELDAKVLGLAITGSRARGIENAGSDLDVVVEIDTKEKEDFLFNVLNQYDFNIAGIKVDINPITRFQTGTLEEYLIEAEKYLERKVNDKMDKGLELYKAVKAGSVDTIKKLINAGADVNYVFRPEEYANTPLHMAAYFAMDEIIKLLVENGAEINSYSIEGKTPLAYAKERHNRENTVELLLNYGAVDGTAPIPDFAPVGEIFLTVDNQYFLVTEGGKMQEFQKTELQKLLDRRKLLTCLDEEVALVFDNDKQSHMSVYYAFRLPRINEVTIGEGIPEEINTAEHPAFKLALVTDEIAAYINPGEDVLTMDLISKTFMDEALGVKKYHETMEKIINHGKDYVYGDKLVSYCRRNHAFENKQPDSEKSVAEIGCESNDHLSNDLSMEHQINMRHIRHRR